MLEAEVCGAYCRRKRKRWRGQKDEEEKEEEEREGGGGGGLWEWCFAVVEQSLAVKRTKHNRKRTRRQSGIGDRHISRKSCHGLTVREGGGHQQLNGTAAGFVFRNLFFGLAAEAHYCTGIWL